MLKQPGQNPPGAHIHFWSGTVRCSLKCSLVILSDFICENKPTNLSCIFALSLTYFLNVSSLEYIFYHKTVK